MNERLLDICIKAGINTWPFNEVGFISLDESELEKFAQLIVQECMKLNSKELSITAIERLLPMYREHFGVEE